MKYFTIKELCQSETAESLGIDNTPTEEVKENLTFFTEKILDPLRKSWGSAIIVNSGYRCPELNKAVGGSETSVHPLGWGVDLWPKNGKIEEFKKHVIDQLPTVIKITGNNIKEIISIELNPSGEFVLTKNPSPL